MRTEPGLRERKKERTRRLIAETAHRLFLEQGFDGVTVAEVAQAADVSEGTVFNYFSTKEELFYGGMEVFEERLIAAVRARPAGESVPSAFRRFVLDGTERLRSEDVADVIGQAARVIDASPPLQTRERDVVARYTDELASLIAEETGPRQGRIEPWVAANALMGVQRAMVRFVRAEVLAGRRGPALADAALAEGKRAFRRIERGLSDYAPKSLSR
jgi:AcrR family transcriptional regulator